MAYNKYKDSGRRIQTDRVLKDKTFKIASNSRYNGYERGLASMVYKFFDKKSKGSGLKKINNYLMNFINQLLINLKKVYSSYKDNIWCVDLADMQLISKYNRN